MGCLRFASSFLLFLFPFPLLDGAFLPAREPIFNWKAQEGDEVALELRLPKEEEKRNCRYFLNGCPQMYYRTSLSVPLAFVVCLFCFLSLLLFSHPHLLFQISLQKQGDCVEFVCLQKLGEPSEWETEVNSTALRRRDERVFGEMMTKPVSLLSFLSLTLSSSDHLKVEGNRIVHHGPDSFDSCTFDFPMTEVYLFFLFLYDLFSLSLPFSLGVLPDVRFFIFFFL